MAVNGKLKAGAASSEFLVLAVPLILDKLKAISFGDFTSDQIMKMVIVYITARSVVKIVKMVVDAYFYNEGVGGESVNAK